jgi:hypothetical protein
MRKVDKERTTIIIFIRSWNINYLLKINKELKFNNFQFKFEMKRMFINSFHVLFIYYYYYYCYIIKGLFIYSKLYLVILIFHK